MFKILHAPRYSSRLPEGIKTCSEPIHRKNLLRERSVICKILAYSIVKRGSAGFCDCVSLEFLNTLLFLPS